MKEEILQELALPTSKVRGIFAMVAMGKGGPFPLLEKLFILDHPVPFVNMFKKQGDQPEIGNLPLLSCITTMLTSQKMKQE